MQTTPSRSPVGRVLRGLALGGLACATLAGGTAVTTQQADAQYYAPYGYSYRPYYRPYGYYRPYRPYGYYGRPYRGPYGYGYRSYGYY